MTVKSTAAAVSDEDRAYNRQRAYRRRLAAEGRHQVLVALARETVEFIDDLQRRHGLRNRSQAVEALIEQGRQATQGSV